MFWLLAIAGLGILAFGVIVLFINKGFKTSYEQRSWDEARFQVSTGSATLTPGLAASRPNMSYQERQNIVLQQKADTYF